MIAQFFIYNDRKEIVNKKLTISFEKEITLLNEFNTIKTVILVKDITDEFNYIYIPKLNKYYFVDRIVIKKNSLFEIYIEIDILKTYEKEILNENNIYHVITSSERIGQKISYTEKNFITKKKIDVSNPFTLNESKIMTTIVGE